MAVLGGTDFKLRSSTHNDPYASFEYEAAAAVTAGDMGLCNDTVYVAVGTTAIGAQIVKVYLAAKIIVPCVEVTSGNLALYDAGCKIYFDVVNLCVTTTSNTGANPLCGIVLVQPAVGDEEVEIHLDGMLGITS